VEKLAASLCVAGLSKSQVSIMAGELDEVAASFQDRPLDRGPYMFVWIDALTQKVREGGRTVNVHCLIATGVNADGCREILGIDVTSSEDGAGWLAFLRGLAARGLSGVALVTSDDHAGLVSAIGTVLPGAAWQRCPHALPPQPAHPGAQDRPAVGVHPGPHHLRAARRRLRARPACPGRAGPGGQAPGRGRAPGRRSRRHSGVHRLSPRGLAPGLVQQPG
jgi:mutator family transposase